MTVLDGPQDDERLLEERARSLARPADTTSANAAVHVVVRVGDQALALPAEQLRQVSSARPITAAPSPLEAVVGVVAVHGQVLVAVDLAVVLGLSSALPPRDRAVVVIDDGAEGVALLVDAVDGLQELDEGADAGAEALGGELTGAPDAGLRRLRVDALLESLDGAVPPSQPDTPGGRS